MASSEQIKALLKSHIDKNDSHFYSVIMQVAATEAQKGHTKFAEELKQLVDKTRKETPLAQVFTNRSPIPISQPKGELSNLLSVSFSSYRISDLVLPKENESRIQRILKENRHLEKIKSHGLDSRRKLLLVGHPGCGKTMTASVIAGELGLPLFTLRLDGLITKYLGETTQKLRMVFDSMTETRGVFLFDEFDSIGSNRSLLNDVGEIKRVLNSFLIFLEQDLSSSLIIAATNFSQSLDHALFRRFDDIIEFDLPNQRQIEQLLKKKLSTAILKFIDMNLLVKNMKGLSYGEIASICDQIYKEIILEGEREMSNQKALSLVKEKTFFKKTV
jgi:SpoVK/Ycf46/Vps4 family AAA+-type ATPase